MKDIKFNDLAAQWNIIEEVTMPKVQKFLQDGWYIGGSYVETFEKEFAEYTGSKHAIGTSNGSDGLKLAIEALDLRGRVNVILPANGFMADVFAVKYQVNAKYDITFIDNDEYFQIDVEKLEKHVRETRHFYNHIVILPVHLYGHPANMEKIMEIADHAKAYVIEDASQAQGAKCHGKMVGSWGDITVYSLYPGKNLGACGDAGIITTNSDHYRDRLMMLRNYGSPKKYHHDIDGWNHRLDPIQAIILSEKLKYLDKWNADRKPLAERYDRMLPERTWLTLPKTADYVDVNALHIYPILVTGGRDALMEHLEKNGVPTIIHYPIALEDCKCNEGVPSIPTYLNPSARRNQHRLLSLPMHPFLKEEQIDYICNVIKKFK